MDLPGNVAIGTGSGRVLGRACAEALVRNGPDLLPAGQRGNSGQSNYAAAEAGIAACTATTREVKSWRKQRSYVVPSRRVSSAA